MSRNIILPVLLLLLTVSIGSRAQELVHYTFRQGLPSNFVYRTCTDGKGLLYIATQKGVVLFDAYRFVPVRYAGNNTPCILINGPDLFFHDYTHGLAKYSLKTGTLTVLSGINYEDSISANDHYDNIYTDSKGRVWCSDFTAVKYYTADTLTKRFVLQPDHRAGFSVQFYETGPDNMLLVSSFGIFELDVREDRIRTISSEPCQASALSGGYILILSGNKLFEYMSGSSRINLMRSFDGPEQIIGLCAGPAGTVYFNSPGNVYKLSLQEPVRYAQLLTFESRIIHSMQFDTVAKVLWIASNKGLSRFRESDNSIRMLKTKQPGEMGNIRAVASDNSNNIWVSNGHLLGYFDTVHDYHAVEIPPGVRRVADLRNVNGSVLCCTDAGLFRLSSKDQNCLLPGIPVKRADIDQAGNYWVIDESNRVRVFDCEGKKKEAFLEGQESGFWTENTWNDIFIDTAGTVWLAGYIPKSFGIGMYSAAERKFKDIAGYNRKSDFTGDYYNRIAPYGDGSLLFSGYGGYNVVTSGGRITERIDSKIYGMQNEHLEGIGVLEDKNVLFGTAEGLHVYNNKSSRMSVITEIDGLPSNDAIYGFLLLPGGRKVVLGFLNTIAIVEVHKLLRSSLLNRLDITAVKINNQWQAHWGDTIVLGPHEHNLSVLFSALNYQDRERVIYRYRMNDGDWASLNHDPELSFNRIEPGTYRVEILAEDNTGNVQPRRLLFYLSVVAPFYKTLWFSLLVLSAVVLLVWLLTRYVFSRKRKIDLLSAKLKELEMQTLRAQMNPHFLFNSLNSIKAFILEHKTERANEYLTRFARLMRNILDNSRKRVIPLDKELLTLEWYIELEAVRLEHMFDYSFIIGSEVDTTMITIPPLILQPFAENAIWHGLRFKKEPGLLEITVVLKPDHSCSVTITDNGIGRMSSREMNAGRNKEHQSVGIEITRERLYSHNSKNRLIITDLKDEQQQACGTSVELIIYPDYD